MAVRYRYIGDGAYLPGIPARDLTDEDLAELTEEQRAAVAASAIYEDAGGKKPKASEEG
jgi:hypothetical protein